MVRLGHIIRRNVAMDLGTANTLLYLEGVGTVLNEPTCVEIGPEGRAVAFGKEAYHRMGKTPHGFRTLRPLRSGVIEDLDAAASMIGFFLKSVQKRRSILAPRVVIGVPSKMTQVEKRAVIEAARAVDIQTPFLIEETLAGLIGVGKDVLSDTTSAIIDIGGGTTEVAVVRRGGFCLLEGARIAGDQMDEAIARFIKGQFGLQVGRLSVEHIKWELGSAISHPQWDQKAMAVSGKDIFTRLPKKVELTASMVREALFAVLGSIRDFLRDAIKRLSTEDREEVHKNGIVLTGGGALIRGMDEFLAEALGIQVTMAPRPLFSVVEGAGKAVENLATYRAIFSN